MDASHETKQCLMAGFGRRDITPEESIPLGGFFNSDFRRSTNVISHLFVSCAALTDTNGKTLLMYQYDNVKVKKTITEAVCAYFREKYGIERPYIHITATHSESSPDTTNTAVPCVVRYNEAVIRAMCEAGEEALADRVPAVMEYGETQTENLNFVKHYFFGDGQAKGDNHYPITNSTIVCHTTKVDNVMVVLRLKRPGRQDIAMVNWRAHNQFTSGGHLTDISADYVGAFCDAAEEMLGCRCLYFQGCCGNVNPYSSSLRWEERTRDFREHGRLLAESLASVWECLTPSAPGPILAKMRVITVGLNHTREELLPEAKEIVRFWRSTDDAKAGRMLAMTKGIYSVYEAMQITERPNRPATEDIEVFAWSVGDIGFASTRYETFDTNGRFVRENSPFAATFVMGYTDGEIGYLPSAYAWDYGCYEADTTFYERGTAEKVASQQLQMLVQLKYRT